VLSLALLFVEYKKKGQLLEQAFSQARNYLISGVRHLAAVGIFEVPIYSLVAEGHKGTVLSAWCRAPDTSNVCQAYLSCRIIC